MKSKSQNMNGFMFFQVNEVAHLLSEVFTCFLTVFSLWVGNNFLGFQSKLLNTSSQVL